MWTLGDYPVIARHLQPISVEAVAALGLQRGDRVLDVAVGNGNAAIEAARRGAVVTGIDLTPAQIERARQRCAAEGVDVDLRVGDAEALDVPDRSFDAVVSVMGVIFAPDHARATAELARACRPDGTVAITAWAADGWSAAWRRRAAELVGAPPPGSPAPDDWGDADEVRRRFAAAGLSATVEHRAFSWRLASLDDALELFLGSAGPFVAFMEQVAAQGRAEEARDEIRAAMSASNVATDGTLELPAPYLLAVARR